MIALHLMAHTMHRVQSVVQPYCQAECRFYVSVERQLAAQGRGATLALSPPHNSAVLFGRCVLLYLDPTYALYTCRWLRSVAVVYG